MSLSKSMRVLFLLVGIAAAQAVLAQTYTVLYSFSGPDGAYPQAGLIRDSAGNLYGTTSQGGTSNAGAVFQLDPTGTETVLYSFTGGADGGSPAAAVIRDVAGNLYGTTQIGGASMLGTVFKLDPTSTESVLHSFKIKKDGTSPSANLLQDSAGNLFGTTSHGGSSNRGTIFKLDNTGKETLLHSFKGADGANPVAPLILDSVGNLYGTTYGSGSTWGNVFKIDPTTRVLTVLHKFTGKNDGGSSRAGLLLDAAGNLYGTTVYGGTSRAGTVFKIDSSGNETVLHSFTGGADGGDPAAGVIMDSSGNLYGTTYYGGAFGYGTVFKLDPAGNETVLHSFSGGTDGLGSVANLVRDSSGNLYGTTLYGGNLNFGVVFKLTP
jgi:uncharacterized repeat protein (TIGR03803 family)